MHFQFTDGGREAAGFKGDAGDCVTRAIAIALNLPYREVYDGLASRMAATGNARSARNGIPRRVYETYLAERGWRWYPLMSIGQGCTVHLRADELPTAAVVHSVHRIFHMKPGTPPLCAAKGCPNFARRGRTHCGPCARAIDKLVPAHRMKTRVRAA